MNEKITLSVGIVTFNPDLRLLQEQAESLLAAIQVCPDTELALFYSLNGVETVSDIKTALPWRQLQSICSSLDVISNAQNLGYGAGHNVVISRLTSTFHLILNPDVVLDDASLSVAVDYLKVNPGTVAVSPQAWLPTGGRQYLAKRYPTLFDLLLRGFAPGFVRKLFATRLARYEYRGETEQAVLPNVEIISGCFMFCRTDSLQRMGGFDESWFLYFEDFDLSLRLHDLGCIDYIPLVRIKHEGGNAANKGFRHLMMFVSSAVRFFNRYGWRLY